MSEFEIRSLRYATKCARCGVALPARSRGHWDKEGRTATCEPCITGEFDRGVAGASGQREFERRQKRREDRIRKKHRRVGGLIHALSEDPQSTKSWGKGSAGERALGAFLEPLRGRGFGVLHDRLIPGTKANIDHILVGPAGVFVIDAKSYKGRVEKVAGKLRVNRTDQSELLRKMLPQVGAAQEAVGPQVRVLPVLCFVDSEWGCFARPLKFGDVWVVWPKKLAELLGCEGPLDRDEIARLERVLAVKLPRA
ncbi:MAG TPA: nuclease-related domain-containing protein [Gaiellaceae bacterium]|nr:nuclease-related domain-containing protein [Gaiellaceae bacterium]